MCLFHLRKILQLSYPPRGHRALVQFVIEDSVDTRKEIFWHLNRMNMNTATLFPGLDGFARSLAILVAFPEMIPLGKV